MTTRQSDTMGAVKAEHHAPMAPEGASAGGASASPPVGAPKDYITLLKPRIMVLVVFTGLLGIVLAPADIHPVLGIVTLLAIAGGAGGAAAINMWFDRDIDARMTRTQHRPIPAGRVEPGNALALGVMLVIGSATFLGMNVSWPAGVLLLFSSLFYGWFYTMVLKRRTPQNIVIGGAAGAFPPIIAWLAVTGGIDVLPVVLFAIVFLWTPLHFWALAVFCADDYAAVGVPMYPAVHGNKKTANAILVYGVLTAVVSLLPVLLAPSLGVIYAVCALILNLRQLQLSWKFRTLLHAEADPEHPGDTTRLAARKLFLFSIQFLFLLLFGMMVDNAF